jgi:leucine dehydrogenase
MIHNSPFISDFQEELHVINDAATGVQGVIAIHSTVVGPAAGGCRFWHYNSQADLMDDAVRLARGMSYKNAMAGLPFGGGKAVLHRPTGNFDRRAVFSAFADAVAALDGQYITAEDVGTNVADMQTVRERTKYVAGLEAEPGKAGGDPSPWTSLGVFVSMRAAARVVFQSDLYGLTVAVQGTGNVGLGLCRLLKEAGAKLIVTDIDDSRLAAAAHELGATTVGVHEIVAADADIFAPCALGGTLNRETIPQMRAKLVCGGANNQLAAESDGELLVERGIVYAPDYVANAGGIINVSAEYLGETTDQVRERVLAIAPRLTAILQQSERDGTPANVVADVLARQIIAEGRSRAAA